MKGGAAIIDMAVLSTRFGAGDSLEAMAASFGVTVSAVRNRLTAAGLRTARPKSISYEQIAPLWSAGLTRREIAVRLGRSMRQVDCARERFGLLARGHAMDEARLRSLVRQGLTQASIATMMGVSRATIHQYVRRLGLSPRDGRSRNGGAARFNLESALEMASAGVCTADIAAHFEVTEEWVRKHLRRPKVEVAAAEPVPRLDRAPAHPWWTPERDLAVYATQGKHAELSELAHTLGRPIAFVQQRWHQLRVVA